MARTGTHTDPVRRLPLTALLLALCLTLVACSRTPDVRLVSEGNSYTMQQAEALARSVDVSRVLQTPSDEAPAMRREVLIGLRRDEAGKDIADYLTSEFPEVTLAVPLHVEVADVDGRDAWIVVEAWGAKGGRLDRRRLWVLAAGSGELIASQTFR